MTLLLIYIYKKYFTICALTYSNLLQAGYTYKPLWSMPFKNINDKSI